MDEVDEVEEGRFNPLLRIFLFADFAPDAEKRKGGGEGGEIEARVHSFSHHIPAGSAESTARWHCDSQPIAAGWPPDRQLNSTWIDSFKNPIQSN